MFKKAAITIGMGSIACIFFTILVWRWPSFSFFFDGFFLFSIFITVVFLLDKHTYKWMSLFVTFSLMSAIYLTEWLIKREINTAMQFCESKIPQLEDHKKLNGHYPESLNTITDVDSAPRWFSATTYSAHGEYFVFSIINPKSILGNTYTYYSKDKKWSYSD